MIIDVSLIVVVKGLRLRVEKKHKFLTFEVKTLTAIFLEGKAMKYLMVLGISFFEQLGQR